MLKETVCCLIVTYNIGSDFYKCYDAIKGQVDEVVIIDNGSEQETIQVLKNIQKDEDVHVIYNSTNLGISVALNLGVKYAKNKGYEWVLTMDNDSEATEDMVNAMLNIYDNLNESEQEKVVSLFPCYVEKGFNIEDALNRKSELHNPKFNYIKEEITSGNLVKTFVFDKIGYFNESLFIDYVDHEFCLKLLKNEYKLVQVEGAILLHSLGSSVKRKTLFGEISYTNHSAIRRYYITRNRLYIWNKYKDIDEEFIKMDKSASVKEFVKILIYEEHKIEKIKMMIKGIKDYKSDVFGKLK